MASTNKKKLDKDLRLLLERITDMVKPTKSGKFKIRKGSRKIVKSIKRNCCHWILVKNKAETTVQEDPRNPNNWKCGICQASFKKAPYLLSRNPNFNPNDCDEDNEFLEPGDEGYTPDYNYIFDEALEATNQILLWEVGMGGNKEDLKIMLTLKRYLPKMKRLSNRVYKAFSTRSSNKKNKERGADTFDMYRGFMHNR